MNTEDTPALGDRSSNYQMAEWNSLAGMEGFYFTVSAGADFGRVFLLDKPEIVIGRSDEADIQVDDEKVSRKHLKIVFVKSGMQSSERIHVIVTDLNSRNGVFIWYCHRRTCQSYRCRSL